MDKLERHKRSNQRHYLRIAETNVPQKIQQNIDSRKCFTPSFSKSKPKSKQSKTKFIDTSIIYSLHKDKHKSSDRRQDSRTRRKTDSKIKNRSSSTMANQRFSKQLDSTHHDQSKSKFQNKFDDDSSFNKIKQMSFKNLDNRYLNKQLLSILNQGKKHLKNNNFTRAEGYFKQALRYDDGSTVQILYLLGICNFHLQNFSQAIKNMNLLLSKDDSYRKNIFFFLAISYKRTNNIEAAIKTLTTTIAKNPKQYEALLFRGKLLSKQKRYDEAISDFNKCLQIHPTKIAPILSKADAQRGFGRLEQSSHLYSQALKKYPQDTNIRLKRAHCYLQMQKYDHSKKDLDQILNIQPCHSQAYYFKGVIYYKQHNFNDALLSFEQSIKHNTSKKAITKSIYEIAKIKIQLRDYYGASYTLQRADSLDVDYKVLDKLKIFLDGSTFLMKKKIKQGVDLLTTLIKKQSIPEFIKSQTYSFRAYGYFCQYKYTHSLNDLVTLEKMGYELDEASKYNKILVQGIIAVQNSNFELALQKFSAAQKLKPNTSDPNIYKGLTFVSIFNKKQELSNDNIQKAIRALSVALDKQQSNWNCSFLRATLFFTLNDNNNALEDIQKAIDKSDDHVIKHFYLRAMIFASVQKYKQALGDFGNVITLMKQLKQKQMQSKQDDNPQKQKEIPEAYLNRAKCFLLFGQKRRAFQDIQSYISCRPLDSQIHFITGNLLFSIGAYEDAIKAYSNCPNIDNNFSTLLQRSKCYLLQKQLNLCLKDMHKIIQIGDTQIKFDYICLDSLRQASKNINQHLQNALKNIQTLTSKSQNGHIFKLSDFHFYVGVYSFYLKNYSQALKQFMISLDMNTGVECFEETINLEEENSEDFYDNRIFTKSQLLYNIGVVHLMLGDKQQASKLLGKYYEFKEVLQSKQHPVFIKNKDSQQTQRQYDITPFPVVNRLCSIFSKILVDKKQFRLSFCLPKVFPPEIQLKIQQNLIQKMNINCTEARPDAPWIKRNSFGVVFTQDLMGCDVDLQTQQQNSRLQNDQKQSQLSSPKDKIDSRKRLMQSLMLDPVTQARLAKIIH